MESIKELADAIYRDRVLRARSIPPGEKLEITFRINALSRQLMTDGIRNQFPDADEQRVQEILAERLALLRRLEQTP